jgi:hypothetical protein
MAKPADYEGDSKPNKTEVKSALRASAATV